MSKMNGEIITYTGRLVKPLDIKPEDIDPVDIAHALSNQCRYTGHTKWFYSVAQHSVLIYDYLRRAKYGQEVCKWGLLHDATEAYLLDLAAPIKHHDNGFGEAFCEAESKIEEAVAMRFGLPMPMPSVVKESDMRIRENEFSRLIKTFDRVPQNDPLPITIDRWSPSDAKLAMLGRMVECNVLQREEIVEFAYV